MTAMALQLCAMAPPSETPKPVLRKTDSGMSDEQLDRHLHNWTVWHDRERAGHGAPSRAGSGMGLSHGLTFDDLLEQVDLRCAQAVEATLDDLVPLERCAVHHEHLAAVYRFPRDAAGHPGFYARARGNLKRGLVARGIV